MTPVLFTPAAGLAALPPLSLYIHIPWCIRKCPYCDFNSHAAKTGFDESAYIRALLADLESELPHIWGRGIETVFIGGGTPSLFSAAAIERLLSGVRALVRLRPDAEITLEANPGTFEIQKFRDFQAAGVNRLSVGVQSFKDDHLRILGRVHSSREAQTALSEAASLFERLNIDLMYGLPGQTPAEALADIRTAAAFAPGHISAYQLTMEPNTAFGHTPPSGLPDEDRLADIEDAVHEALAGYGFVRYETSAFAKAPDQRARHNLNYWQFGDYIGIGAGAHGKISHHDRIERTVRRRHPAEYLAAMQAHPAGAVERKTVAPKERPFEFMLNALRLTEGVPSALFTERTGLPAHTIARPLAAARAQGLLEDDPLRYRATPLGRRFLNHLLEHFL